MVAFFSPWEFLCPCCGEGSGKISELLVTRLDTLRGERGEPVFVNSGWRCAVHNMRVGGSRVSRHLIGCAADIRIATGSGGRFSMFTQLAERLCRLPGWEFLLYQNFIHIAVPRAESARRWSGTEPAFIPGCFIEPLKIA